MNDENEVRIKPARIDSTLSEAFELITRLAEIDPKTKRHKNQLCIPTGFKNIDEHTYGLWPGELSVVTGRPGVGKSSFAINLALNVAKLGARVLLVAPGTNATDTVIRMCAADGRIRIASILNGKIDKDDWGSFANSSNRLSELDMYICDDSRITFDKLVSMARSVVEDKKKALVVIDGIELMTLPGGDHIFDWSKTGGNVAILLKKLAREIDAPILATMDYGVGSRRGDIEDYEDVFRVLPSGMESTADSIFHISRHLTSGNAGCTPSNTTAEIILAKNRLCEPAKIKFAFAPDYMSFVDCTDDCEKSHYNDDRVDELAFNLGMDRASVIDALDSLYDDKEPGE